MSEPPVIPFGSARLARAVRFAFVALVFLLAVLSALVSQRLPALDSSFTEMLGGRPLPLLTSTILRSRHLLFAFSLLAAGLGVAALFSRRYVASFYLLGVLLLLLAVEFALVFHALFAPLDVLLHGS